MWTGAIVVLLTLGSAIGAVALSPGGTFLDDDGNIHEGSIEAIAAIEVTKGCNPPANDLFCPNDPVTRGQMAAFLSRALDLPGSRDDYFIDDGDSVFESEIDRIALAGITKGCNPPTNDRYCPESLVTREVMAAFLVRAFGYTERTGGPDFVDTNGSIFAVDIDRLAAAGVTKGCNPPTNDRFCPNEPVTRAQMATFLTRALRLDPLQPPPRTVELDVVLREDWGAALANESLMAPHTIDTLTVHHAGDQTTTTGPERYRSWQAFHMSRGWGDVAYHYIIGVDGTVYEARDTAYAGDTGTNYDPSGHFLVVVEGNFDHDVPTERQLESLVNVLAWASVEFNVSPATIGGHRDHASTSCPGGNLYPFISSGDLEAAVRTVISGA
jgi:hypothetical protein